MSDNGTQSQANISTNARNKLKLKQVKEVSRTTNRIMTFER